MPPRMDLTGKQFGHLTVLHLTEERTNGKPVWWVRCECGVEKGVVSTNLVNERHPTLTCGSSTCEFTRRGKWNLGKGKVKEVRPPSEKKRDSYPMSITKPCRNCGTPITRICENYNQRVPGYYCNKACQDEARRKTWAKKVEPVRRVTKHKKAYQKAHKVKLTKQEIAREKVLAQKRRDLEYKQALRCHKLQEGLQCK